ncbi:glycoside hydrolase family 43 protein [Phocaeicola salanitronis]|uniref:glycoside hydrolase family 43 protein n=1 Tax=Phocaeicola salanitronis TaxID=376805 RepID=UPI0025A349BE|nr:glycoside hydrolase family 43 protein [Phocaeicola salanitronis]MDM8304696.1 glycoside hydrolase family 43 protein [Phocaeicola salanitronis]
MKKTSLFIGLAFGIALTFFSCAGRQEAKEIRSGELWLDDAGIHVNAHGGGILYHEGTYYWYGENKSDTTSAAMVGIMCYSSKNLTDWKNEGVVLPVVTNDTTSEITQGCIMERPKVIYNEKTGKFVLWFHLELKGKGYAAARSAVAVADNPTGPFKYLRSGRINLGKLPFDMTDEQRAVFDTLDIDKYKEWWTPAWYDAIAKGLFVKRDLEGGQMARDMQLFVDDDGKGYHIYSSEDNLTLQIAELSDDYLTHTGKYVRIAPAGHNEAPAIFKKDGTYWMITSGCTGWEPNEARMFSAPSIWGPWTQHPNPCIGDDAHLTFHGQSTYVLPVHGKKDAFIFMADNWRPKHPSDARYIWLPILFREGKPVIKWFDSWTLDDFSNGKLEEMNLALMDSIR